MAKPTYRVIIPTKSEELLTLANNIIAKHTADDTSSLLQMLNMADFITKVTDANTKQTQALDLRRQSEDATEQRNLLLGMASNQTSSTPGTVRYYVSGIRELLKGLLRGQERKMGDWGFEVNSGSQPNRFRIPMPRNADKLLTLAGNSITKHTADGATSPLQALDMTDMEDKYNQAVTAQTNALQLRRNSETTTQARNLLLGTAKGQGRRTNGTILFYITSVRQVLLGVYRGSEQTLGDWGFEVNTSVNSGGEDDTGGDEV